MDSLTPRLHGLVVPALTPLNDREDLDRAAMRRHLAHLINSRADALFILGSNGEGAMLRSATRLDVVEVSVDAAAGRVPVIAGVLEISTARIVDEIEAMRGRGLDGYVVTTPLYFKGFTEDDLFDHFRTIALGADAPVVLYNIPQFAGATITEGLVRRLAALPNIVGLKDSSGNWAAFQNLVLDRPRDRFALLQGLHPFSAVSLFIGCDGLVPGYANVYPSLFVRLIAAAHRADWPAALELQGQVDRLLQVRGPDGHHASKILGKAYGLMDDHVSSPLPRLSDTEARSLLEDSFAAGLPSPAKRSVQAENAEAPVSEVLLSASDAR